VTAREMAEDGEAETTPARPLPASGALPQRPSPAAGGARVRPPVRLTLLTRAYCHLCDEMRAALVPLIGEASLDVLDVDAPEHAGLEARFGDAVPVLFAGPPAAEHEICRYRLDAARLTARLADEGAIR
jgi:hypothetical protein